MGRTRNMFNESDSDR